jgi:hypothetical protein
LRFFDRTLLSHSMPFAATTNIPHFLPFVYAKGHRNSMQGTIAARSFFWNEGNRCRGLFDLILRGGLCELR